MTLIIYNSFDRGISPSLNSFEIKPVVNVVNHWKSACLIRDDKWEQFKSEGDLF